MDGCVSFGRLKDMQLILLSSEVVGYCRTSTRNFVHVADID